MIELLQRLFIGHVHHWKPFKQTIVQDPGDVPEGIIITLQCEVCGKMKNHRIFNHG